MCGFSDVRRREDGMYICVRCGSELGMEFMETLRLMLTEAEFQQLKREIERPCG